MRTRVQFPPGPPLIKGENKEMNLLDQWQEALVKHPNFSKNMSHNAKIAIMCQTMSMVTGKPKATKEEPSGWNFFFKITTDPEKKKADIVEVFSKSHKVLRTYFDYDFNHPILNESFTNDQAVNNLLASIFVK